MLYEVSTLKEHLIWAITYLSILNSIYVFKPMVAIMLALYYIIMQAVGANAV